jgi:hypothetical protein
MLKCSTNYLLQQFDEYRVRVKVMAGVMARFRVEPGCGRHC